MARGFTYAPADELAKAAEFEEIVARIKLVDEQDSGKKSACENVEAESLLGGVSAPLVKISEGFDFYCEEIAADELIEKSHAQRDTSLVA
ncbi:MAG: hypothetical protein AAGI28_09690 [Pseudomonadota bacterium]